MFKKIIENCEPEGLFTLPWWRHLSGRIQTFSLFVPRAALN